MKNIILILILLFISCSLYSFEVKFGITKDFYEFRDDNEIITRNFGFSGGVVYNFKLTETLFVNFENLLLVNMLNRFEKYPDNGKIYNVIADVFVELNFPLYLNYKFNHSNNIHLGVSVPYYLKALSVASIKNPDNKPIIDYETNNFFIESLIGYEYISENIGFEGRYRYGFVSFYSNRDVFIHKLEFLISYKF